VAIFKLDDKTESIEAVVNEELLNANPELLREDELVIAQGKVQNDRFSGGLRYNISQVWSLADARCRFGRYLKATIKTAALPPLDALLQAHPARMELTEQGELPRGLTVRLLLNGGGVEGEIELGDAARFFPSDEALALWAQHTQGDARIVYSGAE
jgi:DNA polymerase-3 subunit alpha